MAGPGPGLDSRAVTGLELEDYFVSRSNGLPLSGGKVYFFRDDSRTTPKDVFELVQGSGSPPNYTYAPLPNPMVLSAVGTFVDSVGNNVALYYFPYDAMDVQQLYYITVYDQFNNLQFTREAWPFPANITSGGGGVPAGSTALYNQITNGQFTQVLFNQSLVAGNATLVIPYTAAGVTTTIAPGWDLVIGAGGNGTMSVTQIPVAGVSRYPNNPPFTLTFAAGANMTSLQLVQKLLNNPNWAAPTVAGVAGYLSASIMLGVGISASIQYVASSGTVTPQTILNAINGTGQRATFSDTKQLPLADSGANGLNGYDSIVINLPAAGNSEISNVQIIPLTTDISGIAYDPVPSNRQTDYMFHYYNPLLQAKPIPSYLVGWDFPLNPTQFLGPTIPAQPLGSNKSYYIWDQTILFSAKDSGVTTTRDTTGALKTLAAVDANQLALIQYIPAPQAIEMLSRRKCVNISANASVATDVTVSLWYTKAALPSTIAGHVSIVDTINPNGYPSALHGAWVQVPRSGLGYDSVTTSATNAARITVGIAPSGAASFNQYPLSGWDMQGNTDINGATFFAIVVGTASLALNAYILWQSISCQDGDIATVPAAKSPGEALIDCQQFYEMSFNIGTIPQQGIGIGTGEFICPQTQPASTANNIVGPIPYKVTKISTPIITPYNPRMGGVIGQVANEATGTDCTVLSLHNNNSLNGFYVTCTPPVASGIGNTLGLHWSCDARPAQ